MKAAVLKAARHIEAEDVLTSDLEENQARLNVEGCGVCGTDVHVYEGTYVAPMPTILGHEIMGRVEEIRGAGRIKVGDLVVVDPFVYCGECEPCSEGENRFCDKESFIGREQRGGFAEQVIVPMRNLYKLPDSFTDKEGVLAETVATVIAGVDRLQPKAGANCLILGSGCVGLLWNQVLRNSMVGKIFQTDIVPERHEKASILGADRSLSPRNESLEDVVRSSLPRGVDYIIDATGSTGAIQEALPLLKKGGTFLAFGICPENELLELSLKWLYRQQAKIITSRRPPHEMNRAIELLKRGVFNSEMLISASYPLSEVPAVLKKFHDDKAGQIKMMIKP